MNHLYRLVWSRVANSWVAVAETACGKGKTKSRTGKLAVKLTVKLTLAAFSAATASFAFPSLSFAASAADATVVGGSGGVTTVGNTTTITQSSQRLAVNWTGLSTAANEALVFSQPNAGAIALNRITGSSPSTLLGKLSANGQVYILNPNGVLFGAGAQVNVGGLVASTMSMDTAAFMNGSSTFTQDPSATGSVVNQGTLTAASGGYIALLGKTVRNEGTISAPLGTAALGAGSNITLTFSGNSLVHMQVDESVFNTLAENGGLIQANGGVVVMTAGAANSLLASVVNNTGTIEAQTVQNHEGTITLLGGMTAGTVNLGGTLDASAPNGGNGGAIETSAAAVNVAGSATVDTRAPQGVMGNWLIDPSDFTVAASGGNITGAALSAALKLSNMTIDTVNTTGSAAGDINVNDAVNWSSNSANASSSTLTLNAANNININAPITWGVSGTPGDATTTGALVMNAANIINVSAPMNAFWRAPLTMNTGPTSIATPSTLKFTLLPNAGGFAGAVNFYSDAGVTAAGGTGLLAINGNNYTVISDVTPGSGVGVAGDTGTDSLQGIQNNLVGYYALGSNIDASATASWNGGAGFSPIGAGDGFTTSLMFSGIFDGLGHTVNNVTIVYPSVIYTGLFGMIYVGGVIRNVGMVNANVSGNFGGALLGENDNGLVANSFATGVVTGGISVGGLVSANGGRIDQSYANVSINGGALIPDYGGGGLVGTNFTSITNSYAIGNVHVIGDAGGLVGDNYNGSISGSYATGTIYSRGNPAGGLVGFGNSFSSIDNSYATGSVTSSTVFGPLSLGGLIGTSEGPISNSYATGAINYNSDSSANIGGLVGINYSSINNSYATGNISGIGYVGGLVGFNFYSINSSYATGNVSSTNTAGGLVGSNVNAISNSYASGGVSGSGTIGGLVGTNTSYVFNGITYETGAISNSYATGVVTGTNSTTTGALAGSNGFVITNSFYASDTNPSLTGVGNTADVAGSVWGLNTAAMTNLANFTSATGTSNPTDHSGNGGVNPGWDLPGAGGAGTTWFMYDGHTAPLLQAFMTPLTITANNVSKQVDGTTYSGNNGVTYSITPDLSLLLGALSYGGSAQGAASVGSYAITPSGLYSTGQHGYMISFINGILSINAPPAPASSSTSGTASANAPNGASTNASNGTSNNASNNASASASNTVGQITSAIMSGQSSNISNSSDTLPNQTPGSGPVITINLGGSGSTLQIQSDSSS